MATEPFKSINYGQPIPNVTEPFTIDCPPNTDIWEKPPSTHSFNAPIIYQSVDLASFKSARVTVSSKWTEEYDQGGLCLVIDPSSQRRRWVKTGIEYLNGEAHISSVATDQWSDWSLRPMPSQQATVATIEIKSEDDGSLWVYLVSDNERLSPIREVTWWGDLDKTAECWI